MHFEKCQHLRVDRAQGQQPNGDLAKSPFPAVDLQRQQQKTHDQIFFQCQYQLEFSFYHKLEWKHPVLP